jgi:pimeloyl-ACP methyl ester carboxylesterase
MTRVLVLCAIALLCALIAAPAAAAKIEKVKSADGVPIAYAVDGKGSPALVFIHCWSCDMGFWKDQVPYFAKKYEVVTLDLAGHGQSGTARKDYTIQSFAKDVAAVVKAAGLTKVILVGHSMGGPVALEAAKLMPDVVVGVIGIDTYQNLGQHPAPIQTVQFLATLKANFKGTTEQFVRSMFPKTADTTLAKSVAAKLASGNPDIGFSAMKNLMAYDPAPTASALKMPIRAVNSDHFPTNVEGDQKVAPSFKVTIVPGTGHFLFLENPQKFNEALAQTIDGIVKQK